MVGNGCTDDKFDGNALVPFAHGMGLISDELFQVRGFSIVFTGILKRNIDITVKIPSGIKTCFNFTFISLEATISYINKMPCNSRIQFN